MWPCKILWRDPWRNSFCTNLDNDYHYLILGFLVCVYSFLIVDCEKSGPYPLWMHTFYCAADFMGIWVFLSAYLRYDHFWFFLLGTFGEVVWVAFELYCLWRVVTYEREEIWGKGTTLQKAIILMLVCKFWFSLSVSISCAWNCTMNQYLNSGFSHKSLSVWYQVCSGKTWHTYWS